MKHRKHFSNFTFKISEKIGSGCFGEVYAGKCLQTGEDVAIKKEYIGVHSPQLFSEMKIIRTLNNSVGFPSFFGYWPDEGYNALAETLLGNNLVQLFRLCNHKFTMKTIFMLADQMISRLEFLHNKDIIHRDIKPENFLIGKGKNQNVVYLADFGLSKFYRDSISHIHIPYREGRPLVGTARYISLNVHFGIEPSRRDDLESLAYLLIYFAKGKLPWQGFKLNDKTAKRRYIFEKKQSTSIDSLCEGLPPEFAIFLESTRKLDFEETPYYTNYKNLFRSALIRMGENYDYKYCWLPPDSDPIGETRLIKENDQISIQNSTKMNNHSQFMLSSTTHLHCLMAENPYFSHNRFFPRSMDRSNYTHRITLNTAKLNSSTTDKLISQTSILNKSINNATPNISTNSGANANTLKTKCTHENNDSFQNKFTNNHANSALNFNNITNCDKNGNLSNNNSNNGNLSNDNSSTYIRKSSSTFNSNNVLFILDDKKELNANSNSGTNNNTVNSSNNTDSNKAISTNAVNINVSTNNSNTTTNKSAFVQKSSSEYNGKDLFFIIDTSSKASNPNPASTINVSSSSNSVISNYNNSNNNEPSKTNNNNDTPNTYKTSNDNPLNNITSTNNNIDQNSSISTSITSNLSPNNSTNIGNKMTKQKDSLSNTMTSTGTITIRKSQSDFSDFNNIQIRKSCGDFSEIKFNISKPNRTDSTTSSNANNVDGDEIDINNYMNHNIISSKTHKNNLNDSLFSRYNKFNSSAVIHKGTPTLIKPVFSSNFNNNTIDNTTSLNNNAMEDNQQQKVESAIQQHIHQQHEQHHDHHQNQPVHQQQYPHSDLLFKKPITVHQSLPHHTHHHHHHTGDDYLQQFELLHVKKPHPSLWSPNVLLSKHLV